MMKPLKAVGLFATGTLIFGLSAALPAHAGKPCDLTAGVICGKVQNLGSSASSISVYETWLGGSTPTGTPKQLSPGTNSRQLGIKDADGFCVPAGRTARVAFFGNGSTSLNDANSKIISGCLKVRDGSIAMVEVMP